LQNRQNKSVNHALFSSIIFFFILLKDAPYQSKFPKNVFILHKQRVKPFNGMVFFKAKKQNIKIKNLA